MTKEQLDLLISYIDAPFGTPGRHLIPDYLYATLPPDEATGKGGDTLETNILSVPEEHLQYVIDLLRTGMRVLISTDAEVREQIEKWCAEKQEYLDRRRLRKQT